MPLKLMYITNSVDIALIAEKYGVDRILIDLETIGKEERQKGRDSVKSHHFVNDIRVIKPLLSISEMLVRVNSWFDGSVSEINSVIEAGADIVMLPYWKTIDEVKRFINTVRGRCKTILLLETKEGVKLIDDVLELSGVDEIYIGLNDLHLSYGLDFIFEPLINGTVEMLCNKCRRKGIPYGFGGIAKIGSGKIPAEKLILEHYRLGSTRAILSRTFYDHIGFDSIKKVEHLFAVQMKLFREFEQFAAQATEDIYDKNKEEIRILIGEIISLIRTNK